MKKFFVYTLMFLMLSACSDKEEPQPQKEKNPISFCITLIDEHGENCGTTIYKDNLAEYITVKYKDKVYEAKKDSHNENEIYLSCRHKNQLGYIIEFDGIDGSMKIENESFTIDCGNGETNVVTFSNRKENTANGEGFVQECKLNGVPVDKSQIVCKVGIQYYLRNLMINSGLIVSGPSCCQIRFLPVDANGNSLMENQEFLEKIKEGTTFTYRGVTSNIETEYTGSKLKLKVTNESFGGLEKEPRILFGTFPVNKILKGQKLEINWFDGSKDVVDINFLSHYKALNDPSSAYYDPTVPQQEFDVRVNGVQLEPPYPTQSLHSVLLFVYKKVFNWK